MPSRAESVRRSSQAHAVVKRGQGRAGATGGREDGRAREENVRGRRCLGARQRGLCEQVGVDVVCASKGGVVKGRPDVKSYEGWRIIKRGGQWRRLSETAQKRSGSGFGLVDLGDCETKTETDRDRDLRDWARKSVEWRQVRSTRG